ncbi:MAG TPA: nucleoside kinase [Clostridia bacterium]|nr:nucleoside kinase [Clostridia bacterium]
MPEQEIIKVRLGDKTLEVERGTVIEELLSDHGAGKSTQVVAAMVDNKIQELTQTLDRDCRVDFVDLTSKDGIRIYVRGLTFIFIRACRELFPECKVTIEHSMSKGLYCEVHGNFTLTPSKVKRVEERMREIVKLDEPFERNIVSIDEAKGIFSKMGFDDKLEILEYRREEDIRLYSCGWMTDYLYGYMVPRTGYLKAFELLFYLPGVILRHPTQETDGKIPEFVDSPNLYRVFRDSEKWGQSLNVENTAQLNRTIKEGRGGDLIRVCEAHLENQIARIAEEINSHADSIRLILIAGPSSSGKTTFAQRLRVQLMVHEIDPIPISMDDYFYNREDIPVDENGERDLESIDIIDIELFNEQITSMIQGEEVELPRYNFQKGQREYRGNKVKLTSDQLIIVEGIHALNEKLTAMVPQSNKYKIYISALTQLNLDNHNRIPTTDTRLIRRMIRDHQFRGASIEETLNMWGNVRKGEEKNIFPFQEQADVMVNTSLVYELAALKPYILPLLEEFDEDNPYYIEVNRLKAFMKYFVELKAKEIPNNSILREFIGGSCF